MAKASVASGSAAAQKWLAAMQSPQTKQNYVANTANCPVNPMAQAATPAAQQRYADATAMAVSSGKMANALNATPKQSWTNGCATKGAASLSVGANNSQAKVGAAFAKLQAAWGASNSAAKTARASGQVGMAVYQASYTAFMQAVGKPAT
jgi:hypothetical protein